MDINNNKIYCNYCGKELGDSSLSTFLRYTRGSDSQGDRVKLFCHERCYEHYKNLYRVTEYLGYPIYKRQEDTGEMCYLPYWGCRYWFTSLSECKNYIRDKVNNYFSTQI